MTAATLTHLPLAAGGAVLASTGRLAAWAFSRYMRAPLTHTGIFAMATLTVLSTSNALYHQSSPHPAPLFSAHDAAGDAATTELAPVAPVTRTTVPQLIAPLPQADTTGSLPREADVVIGNADVAEMQSKLRDLGFYQGTVDGYYGPQTANAIRGFEEATGRPPRGELTREVMEVIGRAPLAPSPGAEIAPLPAATQGAAEPETAALAFAAAPEPLVAPRPLPAPIPLPATLQEPAPPQQGLRRELPETPQDAMNVAVATAGDAIDTIISGVQTVLMTPPPQQQPARAPAAAVPAAQPQPAAQAQPAAVQAQPAAQPQQDTQVAMLSSPATTPAARTEPAPPAATEADERPEAMMAPFSVTDPEMVARVQRGLASLGFLHGPADGVAGAATAKAIRNFEVYFNYRVTGRISPELLDLLVRNGASI